jgi:protein-S-isoprenylcysteine O-methyltransferase Ste14
MNVEEKILLAHYTEYKNYMTKTKRIIPFLY